MKILVLLGTIRLEFVRPLKELDEYLHNCSSKHSVLVQNGYTRFKNENSMMEFKPFVKPNELDELYDDADLIVSHAGTGSVLKALKKDKVVIGVARYKELGEHVDDHQLDLLEEFSKQGYLIPWYKNDSLDELMKKAETFKPNKYQSQKQVVIDYLLKYIHEG